MKRSNSLGTPTAFLASIVLLAGCSNTQSAMTPVDSSASTAVRSPLQSSHGVRRLDLTTTVVVYNSYTQTIYPGCCLTEPTCPELTPWPLPSVPAGQRSAPITMNFASCTGANVQSFNLLYAPDRASFNTCGLIVTEGNPFSYSIWSAPDTDTDCSYALQNDGGVEFIYAVN
jgi:hypothetical protein